MSAKDEVSRGRFQAVRSNEREDILATRGGLLNLQKGPQGDTEQEVPRAYLDARLRQLEEERASLDQRIAEFQAYIAAIDAEAAKYGGMMSDVGN